jgi:hypothetical protein
VPLQPTWWSETTDDNLVVSSLLFFAQGISKTDAASNVSPMLVVGAANGSMLAVARFLPKSLISACSDDVRILT